jgi:MFS family permease
MAGEQADLVVTRRDRWARASTSAAFAVQGLSFASVISQVPVFRDKFGLDETQLTITLAAVPVIAGVGSVLAGVLAPRIGSAAVLRVATVGVASMAAVTGLIDQLAFFYVAVAFFGLFIGAVDAAMNAQGAAVQRRYGRSVLASCHAWWSVAGIAAAAGAIWAADRTTETAYLGAAGAAGVLIALIAGPGLLSKAREAEVPTAEAAAGLLPAPTRRRGLVIAGVGIALMMMFIGDAATTNWSGIFLEDALGATDRVVRAGLFAYLVCQLLGRMVADRVIGAIGAVRTLVVGALIATAGFAAVALAPQWPVALAGFAAVGLGLSPMVPLTFSAADGLDPAGSGSVIAKVNLFNYVGVIVGSAVIGIIAGTGEDASRLRLAFAVPAGLILLITALAPVFRVVDTARAAARQAAAVRVGQAAEAVRL